MAVTVTSGMTTLSSCEATTGWSAHNISGTMGLLSLVEIADEEQPPKEGTYCLGWDCDIETGGYVYGFTSVDYSSKIVYIWLCVWNAASLEDMVPGSGQSGIFIMAGDATNMGYWHVGGGDTYSGGWQCFTADLSRAPDTNSGAAPTLTSCTRIGIGIRQTAKSKATHNIFIDFVRITEAGTGLKVVTDSGSVATWDDIYTGDSSINAGIISKVGGVYYVQGPIQFGDTTTGDIEFSDSNQVIIFADSDVPSTHYQLNVVGNSTGTINFQMGVKSGTRGVQGCVIKSTGTVKYSIDATDTNIDVLKLYGSSFIDPGVIKLPTTTTSREIIDCAFIEAGQLEASTCSMTYCSFIKADDQGILISSTSHNVSDCSFIDCVHGVHIDTDGTYALSNMNFSGCTYDIENSSEATEEFVNSEVNQDANINLDGTPSRAAQTISVGVSGAGNLSRAIFYLKSNGSPTGSMYSKLYDDSTGPNSVVATSNAVDASTVGAAFELIEFEFEDEYTYSASTTYYISIEFPDGTTTDNISVGTDVSASGAYTYSTVWSSSSYGIIHRVNSDGIVKVNASGTSNPGSEDFTSTIDGAVIIVNTKSLSIHVQDEDTVDIDAAQVRIENSSTGEEISSGATDVNGDYIDNNYNYLGDVVVDVKVRKSSTGTRYYPVRQAATIESTGLSLTITMTEDGIVV